VTKDVKKMIKMENFCEFMENFLESSFKWKQVNSEKLIGIKKAFCNNACLHLQQLFQVGGSFLR